MNQAGGQLAESREKTRGQYCWRAEANGRIKGELAACNGQTEPINFSEEEATARAIHWKEEGSSLRGGGRADIKGPLLNSRQQDSLRKARKHS